MGEIVFFREHARQETKVTKCKNSHLKCYSKGPTTATLLRPLSTFCLATYRIITQPRIQEDRSGYDIHCDLTGLKVAML